VTLINNIKLPEVINIGAVPYKVSYPYIFEANITKDIGLHCPYISEIRISAVGENGIPICKQTVYETLLHEIIHAADYIYCGGILEEDLVGKLGFSLFQLISENNFTHGNNRLKNIKVGAFNFTIKNDCIFTNNDIVTYWDSMVDTISIAGSVDGYTISPEFMSMMIFTTVARIMCDLYKIDLPKLNEEMDEKEVLYKILFNGLYNTLTVNNLFNFFYKGNYNERYV